MVGRTCTRNHQQKKLSASRVGLCCVSVAPAASGHVSKGLVGIDQGQNEVDDQGAARLE